MSTRCGICNSEKRLRVDAALVKGMSEQKVADEFGFKRGAIHRHKAHIKIKLERAAKRAELDADALLDELLQLKEMARALLGAAAKEKQYAAATGALREARACLITIGEIVDVIRPPTTQVNVLAVGGEWDRLRDRIMAALAPFPDAREAVVVAIAGGDQAALPAGDVIDAEVIDG